MKRIYLTLIILMVFKLSNLAQTYEFKSLPYSYNALEPYIDSVTMKTHYDKHHRAYSNNFVKAMEEGRFEKVAVEYVMQKISKYPTSVRNMDGGYWNHEFFWESMSPKKSELSPELLKAVETSFGSLDEFKKAFIDAGNSVFGSGLGLANR